MSKRWMLADLAALDLFVSVVETGSVSKAATWHQISQPSASARLAKLEARLQMRLLQRGPNGSVPTEFGSALLDSAHEVLRAVNDLEKAAQELRSEARNSLKVAASPIVGEYILPRLLETGARAARSNLIQIVNSTDVLVEILADRATLGIAMCDVPSDSRFRSAVIGFDDVIVVVHPNHPWSKRLRPLKPEQFAIEPLVVRADRPGTRSLRGYVNDALAAYRTAEEPEPIMEFGSTNAVKNAALAGVGPAVLSRLTVCEELARGALVEVPIAGLALARSCVAVWKHDRTLNPLSESLVAFAQSPAGLAATRLSPPSAPLSA